MTSVAIAFATIFLFALLLLVVFALGWALTTARPTAPDDLRDTSAWVGNRSWPVPIRAIFTAVSASFAIGRAYWAGVALLCIGTASSVGDGNSAGWLRHAHSIGEIACVLAGLILEGMAVVSAVGATGMAFLRGTRSPASHTPVESTL